MSVTTRTNLATDPRATAGTGWVYGYGTGGTATPSSPTTGGPASPSVPTFKRLTWGTGTTAPSGYIGYNVLGITAGTVDTGSLYVRASKIQTVACKVDWYNGATFISTSSSANVALAANTWSQISLAGLTAPAGATNAFVYVNTAAAGSNWAAGDTLDATAVLFEVSAVVGSYFDGSFVNANSVMYAWTGTANASTSTATTYTPAIALVAHSTFDPCPRVEITLTDVAPTDNVVNVWRTADGKRQAVRGARKWTVNGSNFVIDYEVPLGRSVAYDLEVTSGLNNGVGVTQQTITVNCATWCIQDPLVPSSAIALNVTKQDSSAPYLTAAAVKNLEYAAGVTIVPILGSSEPVALMGQRSIAANVDFSMFTNTASVTTQLRNLIQQTPLLLVRSNGVRNDGVPGLAYYAAAKPVEHPMTVAFGGTLTHWQLTGDLVSAPTMNVLIPVWTYQAWDALWPTYQAMLTALAGDTYLDMLKNPPGT